ncbi:MAG: sigma-70 family RNA polymerase sigma factor [Flavobacteriaceae bacterium]|nr:MAG: sigma-70 family RNA polymerase sigma factor [Flavobacteriaceae bacterium]
MNLQKNTNEELIKKFYGCSIDAFAELFIRHYEMFNLICYYKQVQPADINHIISDSYFVLHKKFNHSKGEKKKIEDIIGYTKTVVRNQMRQFFKSKKKEKIQLTDSFDLFEIIDKKKDELTKAQKNLFLEKLKKILGELEFKYINMRYFDKMSISEIAEETGNKYKNITTSLSNARRKIKPIVNEFIKIK